MVAESTSVGVVVGLVNDQLRSETAVTVDRDLAGLFAYARAWAADEKREPVNLSFSSMLAAMVGHEQPLSRWLVGFFDRLGVTRAEITHSWAGRYSPLEDDAARPPQLVTTVSFRTAWDKAEELRDRISPDSPVATRHFMAAYATCPAYHPRDFRKYRIDRREWCLELIEELSDRFPLEAAAWSAFAAEAPPLMQLEFDADTPTGRDRLHLKREVESIARLIAARSTSTPLSIAVFGAWGSGKSFFLQRLREGVGELARDAAAGGSSSQCHSRIAQVEFNAWHYSEKSLVASLVAHILRNLRLDALDEDEQELQRRATALLLTVRDRDDALSNVVDSYNLAVVNRQLAEENFERARSELPQSIRAAQQVVADTRIEEERAAAALASLQQKRDEAMEAARRSAIVEAVVTDVADETTVGVVGSTVNELVALASELRSLRSRWLPIAIGLVVLAATATFALIAGSEMWGRVLTVFGSVGALAALARAWLTRARRVADLGEQLGKKVGDLADDATAEVRKQYAPQLAALEATVEQTRAARVAAQTGLTDTAEAAQATVALTSAQQELEETATEVARARREFDDARRALEGLSMDSLLQEFLDDRTRAGRYEAELGLFSQVRNDFDRLSRLITKANADHVKHGTPQPTLSRIVLYIDDLDRCPEKRVIEVIQAVHLLLAFPLFVCVVAADPRWLKTCLQHAPGVGATSLRDRADADADEAFELQFGRPAEPADYLEKIFQVPIWLRPIPVERRAGLLRSWLGATPGTDGEDGTPPQRAVTQEELDFITLLAERLDGKPRTLKRLANTYRLVKASLSDVALTTFIVDRLAPNPDGSLHRPYRTSLTLLAVLSGDRNQAVRMAQLLDTTKAEELGEWLLELEAVDPELATFLTAAFAQANLVALEDLKTWLELTRRYSFYL